METFVIKGNLHIIKGKMKQKYAKITNDNLLYFEGKRNELFGQLEKRYGRAKNQLRNVIKKFAY